MDLLTGGARVPLWAGLDVFPPITYSRGAEIYFNCSVGKNATLTVLF